MKYRINISIIVIFFTTLIILLSAYYIRFKFSKRKDIFIQEYWIDSIKGILFIFLCYFMILIFKPLFGRPYYYSVIFNDILNSYLPENWNYDSSKYFWGAGIDGTENVQYKNWWEINDFWKNLKYWFSSTAHLNQTNGWINQDFPSGHTISSFCVISIMFLFINNKKNRKLTNKKISIIWIWFSLILFNMKFSLVIAMTHWWTDVEFSTLFGLLMFFIVPKIIDYKQKRYFIKVNKKYN
ncbi:phosphatase PAP2 family protein [Spiroplasma floricola]|nr:phosphatase PAP2 family protein [Spiroplasma floricola]